MGELEIEMLSPHRLHERGILELLQAIDAHAGPLAPEHIYHQKKLLAYSHATAVQMVLQERKPHYVRLVRNSDPEVWFTLFVGRGGPVPLSVRTSVPLEWIAHEPEARSGVVVDLVRAVATATACGIGWAHPNADMDMPGQPQKDPYQLDTAHWLDVLGPDQVARFGRERVESTPAATREWLPGGGVLLLTRTTPLDFASDEARIAQARAFAHLTGAPEAEVLARLRERSRRLAPVDKDFDPDIAEVLERFVDSVLPINRSREIDRWNQFRPPLPIEQRSATEQPDPVADADGAIGRYESIYAEQLMALLHPHLPNIVHADPSSLPAVDTHFYRSDYPRYESRRVIDDDLVPAVGGFLGALMVKHLGGRWVPQQNLDDTAVIVGDVAWLPFLRARHYLASKDAALTHSLTQFYRAASRSR
jgi:hypothetical protein